MHSSNWATTAWGGSVRVSFIAAFIPGFGPVAGAPRFCNIPRKMLPPVAMLVPMQEWFVKGLVESDK